MDIWSWVGAKQTELVKNGHRRLAELMRRVSGATCDGRAEEVEAIVAEGVALAQAANEPWVELFLRHWRMQSRVFHHLDLREGMTEGVALLEFAHRDVTSGCPQSICATQDFARGFGLLDGRGRAEERLTACDETLARIDRSWACWRCVGGERGDALLDARRFDAALAYARAEAAALEQRRIDSSGFRRIEVEALLALGRPADAKAPAERAKSPGSGRDGEIGYGLLLALVAARNGEAEQAARQLVDVAAISPEHRLPHARVVRELARLGHLDAVRTSLDASARGVRLLDARGARFPAMLVARIVAEAALLAGDTGLARDLLDEAERLASRLGAVDHDRGRIVALRDRVAASEHDGGGNPVAEDPEQVLERGVACDLPRVVARAVDALVVRAREDRGLLHRVAARLRGPGMGETLDRYLDALADAHARDVAFLRAERDLDRGAVADARRRLAPWLEAGGTTHRERMLHAAILRAEGAHAEAIAWLSPLTVSPEAPSADDDAANATHARRTEDARDATWELAIVAALAGDHRASRIAASRLGFEVDTEVDAPIVLSLEPILVERTSAAPSPRLVHAQRLSPVTARITTLGAPGAPSGFGDVVVFDPMPLADAGDAGEPGMPRFTYRELAPLRTHTRVFHMIEGACALDAAPCDALVARLVAHGHEVLDASDRAAEYGVESSPPHRNVRLYLLVPASTPADEVRTQVDAAIALPGYHLVPRSILEALEDDEALEAAYAGLDAFLGV